MAPVSDSLNRYDSSALYHSPLLAIERGSELQKELFGLYAIGDGPERSSLLIELCEGRAKREPALPRAHEPAALCFRSTSANAPGSGYWPGPGSAAAAIAHTPTW